VRRRLSLLAANTSGERGPWLPSSSRRKSSRTNQHILKGPENMTYFCPGCWKIIPASAKVCSFCGCDLAAAAARSYPERLIGSLHHPVPETRLLAAEILGRLRYAPAIAPLLARAREELQERCPDIPLLAALLRSARDLGASAEECQAILTDANSQILRKLVEV
jgi:hypothetical protein